MFTSDVTISGSSSQYTGSAQSFHNVSGTVASTSLGNQWIPESLKISLWWKVLGIGVSLVYGSIWMVTGKGTKTTTQGYP